MSKHIPIKVHWPEDGSASVLGRVTARNGSGAFTGKAGEGNFAQIADIVTITAKVLEQDEFGAFTEITPAPIVTIAAAILDVPGDTTTNVLWTIDELGYNFIFDLDAIYFPTKGKIIRVEFKFTFNAANNNAIGWGVYEGPVGGVETS